MDANYLKPSEYELKRLQRIKENHAFMKSLGLPVPKTPRLQRQPRPTTTKAKKRKVFASLDESESSESSDDSDEDWIPGVSEEVAKRNKMIKRFIPEFRPKRNLLPDFNQKSSAQPGRSKNQSTDDFEDLAEISDQMVNDASLFSDEESTEKEKPRPDPESRYPKRIRSMRASYREAEVPDDDHYLYCEECQDLYYGDCPNHGPFKAIPDNPLIVGGTLTAARASLPDFLEIKQSSIPNAGLGVFLKCGVIPKRSSFGPYQGTKVKLDDMADETDTSYMWEIMKDGKFSHYVDGADETNSNWMRFVNCSRCETEQNLVSYQYKGCIFYRTYKQITEGSELLVWYGDKYAEDLGIPLENQDDDQDDKCESLQCKTCKKTFPYKNMLERHANNGCPLKDEIKEVNCVLCDTKCQTAEEYDGHLLSVHCDPSANLVCPVCKITSKTKQNLLYHIHTHSGYKPFKCTHCNKAFTQVGSIKLHERIHSGVKPYKCTYCNKAFTQESNLKKHERIHSGVKPYKCTYCNKAFTVECNLKTHERIHSGVKPYKCTYCNKAFTRQGDLKTHQHIHSGVKPYKCTYCNKAFTQESNLKKHERIHSGVKPYKCTYCNKAFTQQGYLKKHERIHSGVKPYKCTYCNKAFTWQSQLKGHIRCYHEKCPFVNKG